MTLAPRQYFQVGVLVHDIERARDELRRAVGVEFEEPRERQLGEWRIRIAFSLQGPPYIELIEGPPGSPWDAGDQPHLDHLGFWSDDLDADRLRLESEGIAVAVDGTELGRRWLYHDLPASGMRMEHIEESERQLFLNNRGRPGSRHQQATLDAYFNGINEERYDDVAALFAPDGVLIAPGVAPRRADEIASYFAAALKPYPQHFDDPTRVILAGTTATVEIHFTGTHASGGVMEFDAVDVFDLDADGAIRSLSSWYDSHAVRRRLREIAQVG